MSDDIGAKVQHVLQAGQVRKHECHWPGCPKQVPPAKWGCRTHWRRLPKDIQGRIWGAYRIGQENDGRPSAAYVAAAREAQLWIGEYQAQQGLKLISPQGSLF